MRRDIAGIGVILVHAIAEAAKSLYEKWVDPMTVMMTVAEAVKMLNWKSRRWESVCLLIWGGRTILK
jgi:hypothetical protein